MSWACGGKIDWFVDLKIAEADLCASGADADAEERATCVCSLMAAWTWSARGAVLFVNNKYRIRVSSFTYTLFVAKIVYTACAHVAHKFSKRFAHEAIFNTIFNQQWLFLFTAPVNDWLLTRKTKFTATIRFTSVYLFFLLCDAAAVWISTQLMHLQMQVCNDVGALRQNR